MPCYSPLHGYKSLENGGFQFRRDNAGEKMTVPCGGCLGCRLDRSREWAARIMHEAHEWDSNCFITLTYRDKRDATEAQLRKGYHVPDDFSLDKSHFQKFMKRLRKKFPDRKIRYYHCGEYGDELHRPHYHACLFNLHFPDQELFKESNGNSLFVSKTLEKLWPYGFSTIGELTYQSAAYCARYVLKKVTGDRSHDHYLRVSPETGECWHVQPEYCTMSTKPGIGTRYYELYKGDFWPSDEMSVPGVGVVKKVPRYYQKRLENEDAGLLEEIQKVRQVFRREHEEEYTPERLMDKYKVKKAQVSLLKRTVE